MMRAASVIIIFFHKVSSKATPYGKMKLEKNLTKINFQRERIVLIIHSQNLKTD